MEEVKQKRYRITQALHSIFPFVEDCPVQKAANESTNRRLILDLGSEKNINLKTLIPELLQFMQ